MYTRTAALAEVVVTVVTMLVALVAVELTAVEVATEVLVTSQIAVYVVLCTGATVMDAPVCVPDHRTVPVAGQPAAVRVALVPEHIDAELTDTVSTVGVACVDILGAACAVTRIPTSRAKQILAV
ncbi:hypothetical protein GCM10027085_22860 [Spirosoma aerophilum]